MAPPRDPGRSRGRPRSARKRCASPGRTPSSAAPETEALINLCIDYAQVGRAAESERMLRELEASRSTSMGKWLDELRLRSTRAVHWLLRGDARAARADAERHADARDAFGGLPCTRPRREGSSARSRSPTDGRRRRSSEAKPRSKGLRDRPAPLEAWRILSTLGRARLALGDAERGTRRPSARRKPSLPSIAAGDPRTVAAVRPSSVRPPCARWRRGRAGPPDRAPVGSRAHALGGCRPRAGRGSTAAVRDARAYFSGT